MERYREIILEALFPAFCVGCERDGSWFCPECLQEIEIAADLHTKASVWRQEGLRGLAVAGYYHDPKLRGLVRGLKYHYATALMPSIAAFLRRAAMERSEAWPWAGEKGLVLQAVVGDPERVRARGFDQAEMLRDAVQRTVVPWGAPADLLARLESGGPQAEILPGPLRQANVQGVFKFKSDGLACPEVMLLIDDVLTTGSTMQEAAAVLLSAGAKRVYGFALALGA